MAPPLVHFDYEFSPNGIKTKLLLAAASIPFQRVDQPPVLPRPDLERLGITHRRIPLLAVGKDVYANTSAIFDVVLSQLGGKERIRTSRADAAFEAWGVATFHAVIPLIPPERLTAAFVADRKTIAPVLTRPDFASLAPSAMAELQSRLAVAEDVFLADGPFVGGGAELSVADIHVAWPLRAALLGLGPRPLPGLGREAFPKVWNLLDHLPALAPETVSSDAALATIMHADHFIPHPSVSSDDPLGIAEGTAVTVESMDSQPGSHPQAGKLIGSSRHEIVLALETGVRLHFPRKGYIVRRAEV